MSSAPALDYSSPDELIRDHAGLVKRIAYHLVARLPSSVDVEDLIQAGMIALLEAADSYAPDRGASFATFAGIRIRGSMLDELRKVDWTPRSVHRHARRISDAIRAIENRTRAAARDEDIAAELGIGLDDYARMLADSQSAQLMSLNELGSHGDGNVLDVPDTADGPLARMADDDFRDALKEEIANLPEREALVMSLYYDEEMNMKEIGLILGVSESRICQLHGQALNRLRARLGEWMQEFETVTNKRRNRWTRT